MGTITRRTPFTYRTTKNASAHPLAMVRFKKRYLLLEISFEDGLVSGSLSSQVVFEVIRDAVQLLYGDYGHACLRRSLKVKYLNTFTGVVFVACSRDFYRMAWSSTTFIKNIGKRPCMFRTLHVGGTLRSCQKFLIRHNKDQLLKQLEKCKTPDERKKVSLAIEKSSEESKILFPTRRTKKEHEKND